MYNDKLKAWDANVTDFANCAKSRQMRTDTVLFLSQTIYLQLKSQSYIFIITYYLHNKKKSINCYFVLIKTKKETTKTLGIYNNTF